MKKLIAFIAPLLFIVSESFSQNVGIGTNTPAEKLTILTPTNSYGVLHTDGTISMGTWVGNGGYFGTKSPHPLRFFTGDAATQMTLTTNGELGIGTTPGLFKLKVSHSNSGAGGTGFDIENAFTLDDWEFNTSGNLYLYFNTLFRGGFNSTSGVYTPISDERLKTNIKPMSTMLEKIKQLKPSTYQFKNTTDKQEYNGFIAQDVIQLFPSLVVHNVIPERKLDAYTMDYSGFGVIAVEGIQELQTIIEEQKEKITTLEIRLARLEAVLATITAK